MSDIRINALATTATASASDDYIAIDGSANGTRKLSAYSPTFGGNLTVSGTGTSSVAGNWLVGTTTDAGYKLQVSKTGTSGYGAFLLNTAGGSAGDYNGVLMSAANSTTDPYYSGAIRIQTTVSSPNFQNPVMAFLLQDTNTYQLANVTEKMRIASSGNLLIGTTIDGGQKLQVSGTAYVSSDATFAGTGTSSFAGNLNIKGALGAHQTATLNLAYEGSSVSQLVAYGADASTLGRVNVILRKAGTGTDAVTGLSVRDFGIITQGGVAQTPASASATGTAGTIQWDASYIYVCTATNTWKRVAIATW